MSSSTPRKPRRAIVFLSSFIGTALEQYDFLLYGTAAALVFGQLFFSDLTPVVATIAIMMIKKIRLVRRCARES